MLTVEEGQRAWEEFEAFQHLVQNTDDKFPVLDMMHNLLKPEKQQKHWEFHESMSAAGKRVGSFLRHEPGTTGPERLAFAEILGFWLPYVAMLGGPKSFWQHKS